MKAHEPKNRSRKCMKQKLEELKRKKTKLEILTPWISIWKKTRQKG